MMESTLGGGGSMRHWASEAVLAVSLVMGCAGGVGAQVVSQAGSGGMTGDEIAARMLVRNAERQGGLEHSVGDRTYRVEYRGTGGSAGRALTGSTSATASSGCRRATSRRAM